MEYECEHSYKYWYQNWEVVPYKYPDVQIVVHPGNQKLLMQADIIDWFASFFRFLDQFFLCWDIFGLILLILAKFDIFGH